MTVRTLADLRRRFRRGKEYDGQAVRDMLVSVYPTIIRKSTNESVTSNTTLQNDDELLVAVSSNEEWVIVGHIYPSCTDGTVDIKVGWSAPSGASGRHSVAGLALPATSNTNDLRTQSFGTLTTGLSAGVPPSGTAESPVFVSVSVVVGSTPGNINFQWAQDNSSGTAMTVLAGSFLVAHRVNG